MCHKVYTVGKFNIGNNQFIWGQTSKFIPCWNLFMCKLSCQWVNQREINKMQLTEKVIIVLLIIDTLICFFVKNIHLIHAN